MSVWAVQIDENCPAPLSCACRDHTAIARVTRRMTELLKKAFERASKLPPKDQDAVAALVLAELEAEARWDQAFAGSQDALKRLADDAIGDFRAGRTEPLDPDDL